MDIVGDINPDSMRRIVVASALLMGAVVILFLAVGYYRKRFLSDDQATNATNWTFQDLKEMRNRGEITEEEYQALRASLIASFRGLGGSGQPPYGDNNANQDTAKNFDLEKGHRG